MTWMRSAAWLVVALAGTLLGTRGFQAFAIRRGIVANPNFRSLHERPMPRAGGIVFATVFLVVTACAMPGLGLQSDLIRALLIGGSAAALIGFVDDVFDIRAVVKLVAQMALAACALWAFGWKPIVALPFAPLWVSVAVSWIALVWLINLYNFMDGIDGMAASGAVFISVAAAIALACSGHESGVAFLLVLLAVCAAGFLAFNWPPATIFMGDAGSVSLGYLFGVFVLNTVVHGQLSAWTWITIFGYFAVDTTTTTTLRLIREKQWYGEHRSHAYQNLARVWNSHLRVVRGVTLYHLLWLLPLTIWSVYQPPAGPWAALLAVAPVVWWTLKHGPLMSRA